MRSDSYGQAPEKNPRDIASEVVNSRRNVYWLGAANGRNMLERQHGEQVTRSGEELATVTPIRAGLNEQFNDSVAEAADNAAAMQTEVQAIDPDRTRREIEYLHRNQAA